MVGDSHTASNYYGLNGSKFSNVPKNKFLFYIKFYRPDNAGGSDWLRGVSYAIKTIDRPRVSFKTETLNQYNRKRIVQTGHEFENLNLRFHDSVDPSLRRMFVEYYQYYYGDSKIYSTGGNTVYDVVRGEAYELGKWGFLPPLVDQETGYFFSHIDVYQLYQGAYEKFTLINPKISSYNPDDFDYSSGNVANEIQMTIDFEGITYSDPAEITPDLAAEFGIDRGLYWNVENDYPEGFSPGLALNPNAITTDPIDALGNALRRNIGQAITGQGGLSLKNILAEASSAYDANRGLAVGSVGLNSIKDLVNGNKQSAKQGVQGLLKGSLFGKPGKLF